MEIQKAVHTYFTEAIHLAINSFNKEEWKKTWEIVDSTEKFSKEDFAVPDFQRLVIATSVFAIKENKEIVDNWNASELELFSTGFACDKLSAFCHDEEFALKPKMERFDKNVLDAILRKELSNEEAANFIWNIDEQLYESGMSKEEVLKFIDNSTQESIGKFYQDAYRKDVKLLDEYEKEAKKLCL